MTDLLASDIGSTGRRAAMTIAAHDLINHAATLHATGYRLALLAAHDDTDLPGGGLRVVYLFLADRDRSIELHIPLDHDRPRLPSLAAQSFPASRFEREIHDLYGITVTDHPLPRRLVRHPQWPAGWHPMRRDANPNPDFTAPGEPFPFLTVDGTGVYEIPVGPVHAGLIEPGHFRLSVVGETVLKLKARLWYLHKGVEALFTDRAPDDGIELAERISGDTAVGHTLAYVQAIENALSIDVPPAARRIRAILLELERLYNHTTDLGALCNDVGHAILQNHAQRIKETLLRLNADTTGHRLLRGGVHIGGATLRTVPDPATITTIAADITDVARLALGNSLVRERFTATGILTVADARDLGTLGYVARASGLDTDARRDHPIDTGTYQTLTVPTHTGGDVLARFQQRVAEITASAIVLADLLPTVPADTIDATVRSTPPPGGVSTGVGIVEGWRGMIVHRIDIGADGRLRRVKIVDPSFHNWPAVPVALTGAIVPDFPLVNKSFNLSYAGNDL